MKVCFLGAYDQAYPRNAVLRRGLELAGAEVRECRLPPSIKFWMRYPLAVVRFSRAIRRCDVILVPEFCQKDVPLARFFALLFAKRVIFDPVAARYETKIIDWRRRKPGSLSAKWNFFIDRWAFRLSDIVLADTRAHKDYFCRVYGLPESKAEVLPIGYDDRLFRPVETSKTKGAPFVVLFFGSFLPLHGAVSIVEAAALVSRKDPTVRFKFIGSGQTLGAARIMADCHALRNVEFEGWQRPGDLPLRIAEADVCLGIFGATEKAHRVVPHKVFQAMGMRKPVVTARTPAAEEFFSRNENIIFCDPPYPKTLAAAILALKTNAHFMGDLAERGHRLVSRRYSPQALGQRLFRICEELAGPRNRSRS